MDALSALSDAPMISNILFSRSRDRLFHIWWRCRIMGPLIISRTSLFDEAPLIRSRRRRISSQLFCLSVCLTEISWCWVVTSVKTFKQTGRNNRRRTQRPPMAPISISTQSIPWRILDRFATWPSCKWRYWHFQHTSNGIVAKLVFPLRQDQVGDAASPSTLNCQVLARCGHHQLHINANDNLNNLYRLNARHGKVVLLANL